jgi:hypoxanthine-DNA glycosylase
MIERHPFEPYLPQNAKVLFLGSFPPQEKRWSMDFYYPNFINDFWRVCGIVFYGDKNHFVAQGERRFDKCKIIDFCNEKGIALYDTACAVRRLKDNASDKFLEVVTPTDISGLIAQLPQCRAIVATGQKATEVVAEQFSCAIPSVGSSCDLSISGRRIEFWRMPSTSRAYPMPLERKAAYYRQLWP